MVDDPKSKPPARRRQRPPGKPRTRRPPNWRQKLRKLYEESPFAPDSQAARTLGVAPHGAAWKRWLDEDEQRADPQGIRAIRDQARAEAVVPVDHSMLREALGGDVPAANLVYKRAGVFDEQERARAAAGAPSFNLNVTIPGGDSVDLIKQIRGEIDRGAGARGPGVRHDDRQMLPGSSFLRVGEQEQPVDADFEHVEDPAPTPENAQPAPGTPDPSPRAPVINREGSSRG